LTLTFILPTDGAPEEYVVVVEGGPSTTPEVLQVVGVGGVGDGVGEVKRTRERRDKPVPGCRILAEDEQVEVVLAVRVDRHRDEELRLADVGVGAASMDRDVDVDVVDGGLPMWGGREGGWERRREVDRVVGGIGNSTVCGVEDHVSVSK
jgi:hypothetical protein